MHVQIFFFASCRDAVGSSKIDWKAARGVTTGQLLEEVVAKHPQMEPFKKSILLAVNQTYVPKEHPLKDGDEVAFIPPVSGG